MLRMISAQCVAHNLHTIAPRSVKHACRRPFAIVRRLQKSQTVPFNVMVNITITAWWPPLFIVCDPPQLFESLCTRDSFVLLTKLVMEGLDYPTELSMAIDSTVNNLHDRKRFG